MHQPLYKYRFLILRDLNQFHISDCSTPMQSQRTLMQNPQMHPNQLVLIRDNHRAMFSFSVIPMLASQPLWKKEASGNRIIHCLSVVTAKTNRHHRAELLICGHANDHLHPSDSIILASKASPSRFFCSSLYALLNFSSESMFR